ncbi:MAG: M55 family metallopeptidase [Candidatus Limnocylindrales bacterium]
MRVYISVDMEGIGGISHPHPTDPKDVRYPGSVELMVGETNAAIEGALAAGATDVLVNDSHWNMYNLLPADLHPAARVLQGQKAWSMVAGARPGPDGAPSFDVALFVGYHARAGHPTGTIAHTYSGAPVETRLDGRPTGEYGVNALVLGAWGIPVGLVTGDDALADEVAAWLPWAERLVVKTVDGTNSAISVHPTMARDRVRAGAEAAVRRAAAGELRVLEVGRPVAVEIDYARGVVADHAAIVPGATRVGDRTVRFKHDDPVEAFRGFLAMNRLAGTVDG